MNDEGRRDLRERTKRFALEVVSLYSSLPRTAEAQVLGRQALRSGTSVGANYRESYRSRSKSEFIAKIGDCLKELDETGYWFELLSESKICTIDLVAPLQDECSQLLAIMTTISKRAKANPS